MKLPFVLAALLATTASCASGAATPVERIASSAVAVSSSSVEEIVPIADHHLHLVSPLQVIAQAPPPLPAVELPPALARLLKERAERWRDPDSMKELYTPDAMTLAIRFPGWVTGDERSAWSVGWLAGPLYRPYSLRPVSYRLRGSVGRIAGYYMYGEGEDAERAGFFHLDVEKGQEGTWRISSEVPVFPQSQSIDTLQADELIRRLDEAGIQKGMVLSNAYSFDGLVPAPGDDYANVRWENDWTAAQVMHYPRRLVALCSFNPLKDHALAELERCAKNPAFRGVKLHLGTSPVDLDNSSHVAKTREIFKAANRLRLPLLVHLAASPQWGGGQAKVFLNQLVAAAPDVQVVVAHLWGGAGYSEGALAYLSNAVSTGIPAAENLYFEISQAAEVVRGKQKFLEGIARHMRQIGLNRIYFGSDSAQPPSLSPKESWEKFRTDVPLTEAELRTLANNVAPWVQ